MTQAKSGVSYKRTRLHRLVILLPLIAVWFLHVATVLMAEQANEFQVKAAYLYNFGKFVEWPSAAFAQPDSPIVIGILGTDPFGALIDQIVENKKVGARSFVVKRLKWSSDLKELRDCKILFVGASEKAHIDELIQIVKTLPILTVGETPGFAERGGVIRFVLEDNRVRFEVNVEAAHQAELTISSRLLTLARIIQQAAAETRKPG